MAPVGSTAGGTRGAGGERRDTRGRPGWVGLREMRRRRPAQTRLAGADSPEMRGSPKRPDTPEEEVGTAGTGVPTRARHRVTRPSGRATTRVTKGDRVEPGPPCRTSRAAGDRASLREPRATGRRRVEARAESRQARCLGGRPRRPPARRHITRRSGCAVRAGGAAAHHAATTQCGGLQFSGARATRRRAEAWTRSTPSCSKGRSSSVARDRNCRRACCVQWRHA